MKRGTFLRRIAAALAVAGAVGVATPASAGVIQLGFILDSSGSIGSSGWSTIRTGLANAVNTLIPVGGPDTYEVSVVTFSGNAVANVSNLLVTDAAARQTLANQIAALPFLAGTTDYTDAFELMRSVLANTMRDAEKTYVNFATDGLPNPSDRDGKAARDAMILDGVDNISIEAIGLGGAAAASLLQNEICYPGPCDTTNPYNFPNQGFFIQVANADAYADAIAHKIRVVTGQVPEPATLALFGLGLLGLFAGRRQRSAG